MSIGQDSEKPLENAEIINSGSYATHKIDNWINDLKRSDFNRPICRKRR